MFYCHLIILSRKLCGLCVTVELYLCQTDIVRSACGIFNVANSPIICNAYYFPITTMVTQTHRIVTL